MKKYLALLTIAGILFSCNKSEEGNTERNKEVKLTSKPENGFYIKGKVENMKGGYVKLNQLIGQNSIPKDSVAVSENGEFELFGEVSVPDFYQLVFADGQYYVFILDNKELTFTADNKNFNNTRNLKGSHDNDVFNAITGEVNIRNRMRNEINMRFQQAVQAQDKDMQDQIKQEYLDAEAQSIENVKNIIRNNTNSFVAALGAINFINPENDFEFMDSISNVLNQTIPESRYTKELFMKVNSLKNVSVGAMAPDISLPDPNGKVRSLSEFRGKYVLIDFWASWCGPCRRENPNVVKTYEKYKDKDFEIFGVSLDKQNGAEKWKKAIEKDGINWTQVSDLMGWQSSAAASYKVRSIPATFLIDPNGKILAKNLRGAQLEEKLKEILG